jgi:hypothetical protein
MTTPDGRATLLAPEQADRAAPGGAASRTARRFVTTGAMPRAQPEDEDETKDKRLSGVPPNRLAFCKSTISTSPTSIG